jgi:predicted glycoside hydrolase/deacetylase ChbG (UPF0249 family)
MDPFAILPKGIWLIGFLLLLVTLPARSDEPASLAQRLGYKPTDKLLIINGDDAGMCHAANVATLDCLQKGLMRSCTVMVPCPWFPEIAAYAKENPEKDFGVHLCHTAEWSRFRWGPVLPAEKVPGLVDPDGYLWRGVEEVYAHATPEEALSEGRAQIRRAMAAGIDVTHLDSHMGTMQLDPRFMEAYFKLALEFNLPVRMASQETLVKFGAPKLREQFSAKGILFPDYFVYEELKEEKRDVKGFWMDIVGKLKPGVTELYIHAGLPTDELKAITGTWSIRGQEYEVFTNDPDMKKLISDRGVVLIGYRPLRELQRKR